MSADDRPDVASAEPWHREEIRAQLASANPKRASGAAAPPSTDPSSIEVDFPGGFEMRDDGLYRLGGKAREELWLCSPFRVLAEARPDGGDDWGLLLAWHDRDGKEHFWVMRRALLAGDAAEVRAHLSARGLLVSSAEGARRALAECLARVRVNRLFRTVSRVGWHFGRDGGAAFVLPGGTYGTPPSGESLFLTLDPPPAIYQARGTLEDWCNTIAARCIGNSRLVFVVSLAFSGPLMAPLGEEGGGFHLRGDSSMGKTTALQVSASVWGAPRGPNAIVRAWRTTGNALEAVAAAHNDNVLLLDEIGQVDPREVGEIAYMLANGQGKNRMRDRGGLRRAATWRVLMLSSGEEGMGDLMARAGHVVKAGQEVRFLDLPADAGAGVGLFETLHTAPDGDAFARALGGATMASFGSAGPAFLEWLAPRIAMGKAEFESGLRQRIHDFAASLVPVNAESQVLRAAGRFALVAIAGELATEAGVTGWRPGEAMRATKVVFEAWLAARGGSGNRETQKLLEAVKRFVVMHGASRFETVKDADQEADGGQSEPPVSDTRTINRAGWKWQEVGPDGGRRWVHGFAPGVFESEVAQPLGMVHTEARAKLDAAGVLRANVRGGKRRRTIRKQVPGHGSIELVVIEPNIVEAIDDH